MKPHLILASASPRRARILESLGIRFLVVVPNIDEHALAGESALQAVQRLARAKALSIEHAEPLPILAADTVVTIDGQSLGKPSSPAEACAMLRRLAGRSHEVISGVCMRSERGVFVEAETTQVVFSELDARSIEWYVATGEPLDKAGGYHIDGLGAYFVRSIQGSPSNVAGLPVSCLVTLARRAGIALGPP